MATFFPSRFLSAGDGQDAEEFSDDSGVDVRPQAKNTALNLVLPDSRRNKRKSSEPKRRKDVLLMKRFRWDTDEEENEDEGRSTSEVDDAFDEGERPSSGDSGCLVELIPEPSRKKRTSKKSDGGLPPPPAPDEGPLDFAKPSVPRQSVIQKREDPCSVPSEVTGEPKPDVPLLLSTDDYDEVGEGPSSDRQRGSGSRPRNYKSMSRQRRIEANARERTRVHTISAAFDSLRRAVPAYAHNQKLSKLAILRIASAYIVALACLNDQDYSQEQNGPSLSDCVEQCTRTIQAEGRSRRRTKD